MHEWTGKIQASWSDSVIYNFQINMQRKEQASNIHLCLYQVTHCNALQAQVSMVNRARLANTSQVSKKQLCPPWENFVTGKENLHGWSIQQNQVQTVFLHRPFAKCLINKYGAGTDPPMGEVVDCSCWTLFSFAHSFLGGKSLTLSWNFPRFIPVQRWLKK